MAHTVEVRSSDRKQKPGFDGGGVAKNHKLEVIGEIDVTSYVKGGSALAPSDVGLTRIDHIRIEPKEPVLNNDPEGDRRHAHYSFSAQQFYVVDVDGAGTASEATAGTATTLTFHAWGDSAFSPELR